MKRKILSFMLVATLLISAFATVPATVKAEGTSATNPTTKESGAISPHQATNYDWHFDSSNNYKLNDVVLFPGDTVTFHPQATWDEIRVAVKNKQENRNTTPLGYTMGVYIEEGEGDDKAIIRETGEKSGPFEILDSVTYNCVFEGDGIAVQDASFPAAKKVKVIGERPVVLNVSGTYIKNVPFKYHVNTIGYDGSIDCTFYQYQLEYYELMPSVDVVYDWVDDQGQIIDPDDVIYESYGDVENPTVIYAEDAMAKTTFPINVPVIEGYNYTTRLNQTSKEKRPETSPVFYVSEDYSKNAVVTGFNKAGDYGKTYGSNTDVVGIQINYKPGYTVTLDANGGTIEGYESKIYEIKNSKATSSIWTDEEALTACVPIREGGYHFVAWCADEDLEKPVKKVEDLQVGGNYPNYANDLYAKWSHDTSLTGKNQEVVYTGKPVDGAAFFDAHENKNEIDVTYYKDEACTEEIDAGKVVNVGTYYAVASVDVYTDDDLVDWLEATSDVIKIDVKKADSTISIKDKTVTYTDTAVTIDPATVTGSAGAVTYTYYSDKDCKTTIDRASLAGLEDAGTYYVVASVAGDANYNGATSEPATLTIAKDKSTVTLEDKTVTYNGESIAIDAAKTTGSNGKITYQYYTDEACTKSVDATQVKNAGTYYVTASIAANVNYEAAKSKAAKLVIQKANQSVTIKQTKKTISLKKKKKLSAKKTFTIGTTVIGEGNLEFAKVSVTKKYKKYVSLSKKGLVTIKKKAPKGKIYLKVAVIVKDTDNYSKSEKVTKTIKITLK